MFQKRMIASAMTLLALAAVGGSSVSEDWRNPSERLVPALARGGTGGDEPLLIPSATSNRQYALDALALKYVGDYVNDPEVVSQIQRVYWCGTPMIEQLGIPAAERSETALRNRARAMVARTVPTGQRQPAGAEPWR